MPITATAAHGVPAQEMTKWFDTNYHYMVPEFSQGQTFALASRKPIDEYRGSQGAGLSDAAGAARAGHVPQARQEQGCRLRSAVAARPAAAGLYRRAARLADRGAEWVQIDEPCLVLDLDDAPQQALRYAYRQHRRGGAGPEDHADDLFRRARRQSRHRAVAAGRGPAPRSRPRAGAARRCWPKAPTGPVLSLGVIDGRNIWRADLPALLDRLEPVVAKRGTDHVQIAPSCSLLHVPIDLDLETDLDPDLKSWLAFCGAEDGGARDARRRRSPTVAAAVEDALASLGRRGSGRKASPKVHDAKVAARIAAIVAAMRATQRRSPSAPECSASASTCRRSRPRPSARSRRRPRSARHAPRTPRRAERCSLRDVSAGRDRARRPLAGGASASTCWCTASSSATTWCSISANSFRASPSPSTAGCSPTARAACDRRSCSATSRVRSR